MEGAVQAARPRAVRAAATRRSGGRSDGRTPKLIFRTSPGRRSGRATRVSASTAARAVGADQFGAVGPGRDADARRHRARVAAAVVGVVGRALPERGGAQRKGEAAAGRRVARRRAFEPQPAARACPPQLRWTVG